MNEPTMNTEIYELRNRNLSLHDENEELKEEIEKLLSQIEEFRIMYISTVEYASSIENEMQMRLKSISNSEEANKISDIQPDVYELKEKLSLEISKNEKLIKENEKLKERMEQIRLLYINTTHHATILENELDKKYHEVTQLSVTDPLTGVFNRLKFHRSLNLHIDIAKNENNDLSIIMFDLDHFKRINDTYGHDRGDDVLKKVTDIVRTIIRKEDTFARWGGEEFMILVPASDLKNTYRLAERIRKKIALTRFDEIEVVTCSFGVTGYKKGENPSEFLKRVDDALYEAKSKGRNRAIRKEPDE